MLASMAGWICNRISNPDRDCLIRIVQQVTNARFRYDWATIGQDYLNLQYAIVQKTLLS